MFSRASYGTPIPAFGLNWTDHGARMYDASIGRWNAVDPLADNFAGATPYNYCFGDPVNLTDKNGMSPGGEDDAWWMHHREQYSPWRSSSTFTSWEGVAVGHGALSWGPGQNGNGTGWGPRGVYYDWETHKYFDSSGNEVSPYDAVMYMRESGAVDRHFTRTTTWAKYDEIPQEGLHPDYVRDKAKMGMPVEWKHRSDKSWLKAKFQYFRPMNLLERRGADAWQLVKDTREWSRRNANEALGFGVATAGVGLAIVGVVVTTTTEVAVHAHHLFPVQFKEWFTRQGIDIEKYKMILPKETHMVIHGKGGTFPKMTKSWNAEWKQFIDKSKNPSIEQIFDQLNYMINKFGIGGK